MWSVSKPFFGHLFTSPYNNNNTIKLYESNYKYLKNFVSAILANLS